MSQKVIERFPPAEKRRKITFDPQFDSVRGVRPPDVVVEPEREALQFEYHSESGPAFKVKSVKTYISGSEPVPENDVTERYFDLTRSGRMDDHCYILTFNGERIPEQVTLSYVVEVSGISWGPDIRIGPRG